MVRKLLRGGYPEKDTHGVRAVRSEKRASAAAGISRPIWAFRAFSSERAAFRWKNASSLRGEGEMRTKSREVRAAARTFEKTADRKIWDFSRLKKQGEEPCVAVGLQCDEPYRCWYYEYCHGQKQI